MAEENGVDTNQYLTFTLGDEVFALDIATVREVLELTTVTKIPRTPEFMRGVINLRGHAVPVVDMRVKFGMDRAEDTVNTCIIIVEVVVDGEPVVMGAVADSVREVFEMSPDKIDPPPKMGTSIDANFIKGMGKQDESFIIILDINKVFSIDELAMVQATSMGPETAPVEPNAQAARA
ncbi:MAG: chemotaxis protein CheW [Desulfovibrio sp.]|nr:MAG: chemotaxis protein CheW [Desulfovibrio sp.]